MVAAEKKFVQGIAAQLVGAGVIEEKEAAAMIKDFENRSKVSFDYFLLDEGLVAKDDLLDALSRHYEVPAVDVSGMFLDSALLQNFPKDFLLSNGVVPIGLDQNILVVIAHRPDLPGLAGKIEEYSSYVPEFRVGLLRDIIDAVRAYYDEPEEIVELAHEYEDEPRFARTTDESRIEDIDDIPDEDESI